ncbi:unnamed protein product [Polarella glacialis]|uniref:Uncharacterized protein n=1 Tax=Polarella glacialis TaxID=89957 RepID=A0A813HFA7_POLGL|nr:unnamed protein product [Polarella glacialis]
MADVTEVGFIFQCVLCGSFSIFAVDALCPHEVALRARGISAGIGASHKTQQKEMHKSQEEILEAIQQRLQPPMEAQQAAASAFPDRTAMMPCSTCFEIRENTMYFAWLDDVQSRDLPVLLCPHVAVTFDADEGPPAYVKKAGKWILAQGVGPKDLDCKMPYNLPAGQFRALLPPSAPPLRPPCWKQVEKDEGAPPEVWEARRQLIGAAVLLATVSSAGTSEPKPKAKGELAMRAPAIGEASPWLPELMEAALEAWQQNQKSNKSRGKKAGAEGPGACYVQVPVLSLPEAVRPLLEAQLQRAGLR